MKRVNAALRIGPKSGYGISGTALDQIRDGQRALGQDCDRGFGAERREAFVHFGADVAAGHVMRGADHVVGEGTVDEHPCPALDERGDLRLPFCAARKEK